MKLIFVVFVGLFISVQAEDKACDLSQETMTKYAMECLAGDPSLMLEIIEHMEHPDALANMKFVCANQAALVDVAICMEKKMAPCIPEEYRMLVLKFANRQRLSEVLGFICSHQAELGQQCMDNEANQQFAQCMQERGQALGALIATSKMTQEVIRGLMCRFDKAFEGCLDAHHGKCSHTFVSLLDQMVKMMLPEKICEGVNLDSDSPASKLLSSLLIHGAPLTFNPETKKGPSYFMPA